MHKKFDELEGASLRKLTAADDCRASTWGIARRRKNRQKANTATGHEFKLKKTGSTRTQDVRKHFLSQRVLDSWNALPSEIVRSATFAEFKRKLDTFLNKNKDFLRKYMSSRKHFSTYV